MQSRFSKINSIVEPKQTQTLNELNNNAREINQNLLKSTNFLKFSECIDAIDELHAKNKKIIYALQGSDQTRLTNQSNLHQKISNFTSFILKVKEGNSENKKDKFKEGQQKQDQQNKQSEQKLTMRYFTIPDQINDSLKCRRCGEFGHYQRSCTQSFKAFCSNCLGKHFSNECSQFTCNRCNLQGHMYKNCQHFGKRCYKCDKYGHRQANCGTLILFEDLQNGTRDLDRMRCLYCNKKGHMNCYQNNKKDSLYSMYNQQSKQRSRDYYKDNDERRNGYGKYRQRSSSYQQQHYQRKQKQKYGHEQQNRLSDKHRNRDKLSSFRQKGRDFDKLEYRQNRNIIYRNNEIEREQPSSKKSKEGHKKKNPIIIDQ